MSGNNVQMLAGSVARATGGTINITAAQSVGETTPPATPDGSRVYVAPGAELDVSGAQHRAAGQQQRHSRCNCAAPSSRTVRCSKMARLRSQTVYVDIRQGTPLADISGEIAAIGYNVVERNLNGGTITSIRPAMRFSRRGRSSMSPAATSSTPADTSTPPI